MSLFEDISKILNGAGDLAERGFFCEDFAAYPNNENSLTAELEARFDDENNCDLNDEEKANLLKLAEGVTFECVDQHGGEDEGRDYYWVWKFIRGDESTAIRFQGWYASHYGSEYEDFVEVHEVTKTVTVWE